MHGVKESFMSCSLVACGMSKRVKINVAATNMHNKEICGNMPVGGVQRNIFVELYPLHLNKM